MIHVLTYDREQLKAEMKKAYDSKTVSPLKIEKRKTRYDRMASELRKNQFLRDIYSIGKTEPIKIGNLIINHKLFKAFIKNLKGYQMRLTIEEQFLILEYEKRELKGQLKLKDLSVYYEGFQYIPAAEVANS